ncbi:TetR/AcrR family transcriptional regulator [Actinomadura rugatobispora]|uniref:TetR/AcrR family transcriptional regulator n=1 Tax=Actinomadura rugatobispora TaxID=1994 RepID=A0ABW0ZWJ9_9ACTN|nr:TetR/AcrR family transcriptional regulator [Actinomadura rugatobispora]
MTTAQDGRAPRADARRNRERIVEAARETFAAEGPGASLNEIARRAGIGPGTLYRHFPNRAALQAAVLQDRIERLCARAAELRETASPDEALALWLRAFLAHARTDHGLAGQLMVDGRGGLGIDCHQMIRDAAASVLDRARSAGAARPDVSPADMIDLVVGVALAAGEPDPADPGRPERLLGLVLDALRG